MKPNWVCKESNTLIKASNEFKVPYMANFSKNIHIIDTIIIIVNIIIIMKFQELVAM